MFDDSVLFLAVCSQAENFLGGIYSVAFAHRNEYSKLTTDLEKWCLAAKKQMDKVNVYELEERFRYAPKIDDKEIILTKPLTFKGRLDVEYLETQVQINAKTGEIHLKLEVE
jgi:hypothetical protein